MLDGPLARCTRQSHRRRGVMTVSYCAVTVMTTASAIWLTTYSCQRQREYEREKEAAKSFEAVRGTVGWRWLAPDWLATRNLKDRMPYLQTVTWVYLSQAKLDQEHIRRLAHVPHIRKLTLADTNVTDADLPYIGKLRSLEVLDISGTGISDEGLKHLGECRALAGLLASDTRITGTGLRHVRSLERLFLSNCPIKSATLERLHELHKLNTLVLSGKEVDDAVIEQVSKLVSIECLSVSDCDVSDTALAYLAKLPRMANLTVEGQKITDNGLAHLKRVTTLKTLTLSNTRVTAAGIGDLKRTLPELLVSCRDEPMKGEPSSSKMDCDGPANVVCRNEG